MKDEFGIWDDLEVEEEEFDEIDSYRTSSLLRGKPRMNPLEARRAVEEWTEVRRRQQVHEEFFEF